MRQRQRRDSAREWIRSGAAVTVKACAKRYGVDRYTAYDDLTALAFALHPSAQQWARRPPATPRGAASDPADRPDCEWIMLDGRPCFVVGCTPVGAPYGVFADDTDARQEWAVAVGPTGMLLRPRVSTSPTAPNSDDHCVSGVSATGAHRVREDDGMAGDGIETQVRQLRQAGLTPS